VPGGTARHGQAMIGPCLGQEFSTVALSGTARVAVLPRARAWAGPGSLFEKVYSSSAMLELGAREEV